MSDFWTSVQLDGNYIYHRGVAKGKRFKHKIEYKPALYYPSNKVGAWRTIEGIPLEERRFANIWEARAFAKKYADVENFKVYGNQRYQYAFIGETYPGVTEFDTSLIKTAIIDIEVDSSDGFPDPAIADKVITAITLHVNDKFTALGCKEWQPSEGSDIEYFHCDGELDLLTKFIGLWEESSPDIVTGWNINLFDIPYLVNRITKLMGAASAYHLSPWNKITARTVAFGNREFIAYDIMGVAILDYLELYKQAAKWGSVKNQESYALDHIAEVEIEEHKLDYRAQGYPTLNDLYNRNFSLYMEYNIHDVNLVHKIDNKLHLIDLALTLAYMNKVNFDDVFSQGRMWDAILYNRLHLYNVAIPPSKDSIKRVQFEGAYVKEPAPGRYRWLASFDLTSLYPHLIMMYNMSPETLVQPDDYDDDVRSWLAENGSSINVENMLNQKVDLDWLKAKNLTMTPNGQFFHCGRPGFLAQCMEDMYAARAKYKKQELDYSKLVEASLVKVERTKYQHLSARYKAIQTAIKITLNSCYGSLGSPYFRYFDVRIAEAVTLSGQLSIRWVQKAINEYLNKVLKTTGVDYVLASDTDSIYLLLDGLVEKLGLDTNNPKAVIDTMNKICEAKIRPFIEQCYDDLAKYVNAPSQRMVMKREALADQAIWMSKKNYILSVYDQEGIRFEKPVIKITGWAAVRTDKPQICRKKLKDAVKLILDDDVDQLREFVEAFRTEFKNLPIIKIASPKGITELEAFSDITAIFIKGTPMHVKGALAFNHWIDNMGLDKRYEKIKAKDKIKYIYLKNPNPFQVNVMAFLDEIPNAFNIMKYIDYEMQFEVTFIKPLTIITEAIGWQLEQSDSLDAFFG